MTRERQIVNPLPSSDITAKQMENLLFQLPVKEYVRRDLVKPAEGQLKETLETWISTWLESGDMTHSEYQKYVQAMIILVGGQKTDYKNRPETVSFYSKMLRLPDLLLTTYFSYYFPDEKLDFPYSTPYGAIHFEYVRDPSRKKRTSDTGHNPQEILFMPHSHKHDGKIVDSGSIRCGLSFSGFHNSPRISDISGRNSFVTGEKLHTHDHYNYPDLISDEKIKDCLKRLFEAYKRLKV